MVFRLGGLSKALYEIEKPCPISKIAICARRYGGSEHPDTADCLNNLALLYKIQGEYDAAEPLYLRALSIREMVLGFEHPDTAVSLNNLATLYNKLGRYDAAAPLYERAVSINDKALR